MGVGLAQAAMERGDVGDVLQDLVVGTVTADDEVFGRGVGRVLHGMRLRVMLPGRV